MTQVANSSLTAYLTNAEMLTRFDANFIGQLVSDNDLQIDSTSLLTNAVLTACIADACGMLESACLVGERYSALDLQALVTQAGVSASFLKRIVANLTLGLLRMRRGMIEDTEGGAYSDALNQLERLRLGERIFAFAETEEAGTTQLSPFTQTDIDAMNLLTTSIPGSRFFGLTNFERSVQTR